MLLLDSQPAVKEATVLAILPTASVNQTVRSSETVATISEQSVVSTCNELSCLLFQTGVIYSLCLKFLIIAEPTTAPSLITTTLVQPTTASSPSLPPTTTEAPTVQGTYNRIYSYD